MTKKEALKILAMKIKSDSPSIDYWKGLRFSLNENDHNPPHVHVQYQDDKATFTVDGSLEQGKLPDSQLSDVKKWFKTRFKEKTKGWECDKHGNWRKTNVSKFKGDINAACTKDNDYFEAIQIQAVTPLKGRYLEVWFGDGSHKLYDMMPYIKARESYKPLLEKEFFDKADNFGFCVSWNDDIDIAEYELYRHGIDLD